MFLSEHNNLARTGMSEIESAMPTSDQDFVKRKLLQQLPTKQCFAKYTRKLFLINVETNLLYHLGEKDTITYNQGMKVQEEEILSGGHVQVVLYFHLEFQGKLHHYLTYAVSLCKMLCHYYYPVMLLLLSPCGERFTL